MKLVRDARFTAEAAEFDLRMHCEDCAYFDAEGDRCVHGYPTAEHRASLPAEAPVVFCKEHTLR